MISLYNEIILFDILVYLLRESNHCRCLFHSKHPIRWEVMSKKCAAAANCASSMRNGVKFHIFDLTLSGPKRWEPNNFVSLLHIKCMMRSRKG